MFMDYLENILQLITILAALLISLFRYIDSKKRSWLYSSLFFLGSLLSSYFWTAYLVIMGSTPNVSDLLAYFGWNAAFVFLLVLVLNMKSREEKKYFNVLMLLPIPLNIWQLTLYMKYGGVLNSVFQVTVCTAVACFCIQSVMWYLKNRMNGAKPPYVAMTALLYVALEFGMWTSSSLDGWISGIYYPCSFACSLTYLLLIVALNRTRETSEDDEGFYFNRRVQNILKTSYIAVTAICSLGGILLGIWIKNVLNEAAYDERESGVYVILPVILFLISILIAIAATVIIIVVYFEQNIVENHRLREARRAAEQSNTAKSEFLAHMSHEIRTPINAVIGMNEMIRHKSMKAYGDLPAERESIRQVFADITDYSVNIDSAGNSLLSIINDILDLSKIEAGKLEIREARYELSSILNDVSNMVGFRAQAKGLEYIVDVEEELPDCLYGDEVRLRQIVTNVLNNAVKYTPEGKVTLSVTGEKPYQNEAGRTLELTFTVRDTGIGMRQEDLGKLYQRFERMDMAEKSSIEGTGLGLAITHQLLDMMNGRIEVRSKLNKGSEFIISIPQRIESAEPIGNFREKYEKSREKNNPCEDTFYAPSARILIVDDIRMNLMVATGLLMDTGIKMDLAGSGAEALRLFSETDYDMVFLDQRMPEMDGIETLHRLRKKEGEGKNTPVVCLTADAIEGAKKRYMEEGFTDYITKPIDGCALKNMVLRYLPKEKIEEKSKKDENDENVKTSDKESIINETKEAPDMEMTDKRENGNGTEARGFFETLIKAGVDPEKGMENSQNDENFYQILLNEYLRSAPDRMEKLKKYFEEHDKKNYAIQAHSLKSTSRTIGAVSLGDTAEWLEKASDGENWDDMAKKHSEMLEKYDMTVKTIKSAMPKE